MKAPFPITQFNIIPILKNIFRKRKKRAPETLEVINQPLFKINFDEPTGSKRDITPENETKLANLAKGIQIENKRLRWAVKFFARPIIKLFDNLVLDRLPDNVKIILAPALNIIIEEL
jgi:hypothetical protein